MSVDPRATTRRPVREPAVLHEPPSEAFAPLAPPTEEAVAPRPESRHIPRFVVLPGNGEQGVSTAAATGAHRFPGSPTPVIGAAVSLMGFSSLEAAVKPWQRKGGPYQVARVSSDPSRQGRRSLASSRWPKV